MYLVWGHTVYFLTIFIVFDADGGPQSSIADSFLAKVIL